VKSILYMPCRQILALTFWVTALFAPTSLYAHGDLNERIQVLTQAIQTNSANPELFLQRGELQWLHGQPQLAVDDFKRALDLNPTLSAASLGLARSFLDLGKSDEARTLLHIYLEAHPTDPEALLVRARALARLGDCRSSAADYTRALEAHSVPLPDIYLERANVLVDGGLINEALSSLDEGISKFGRSASLQMRAIELELIRKNPDAALRRLDALIDGAPRKEFLLWRRAAILEDAGRLRDARESYLAALAALRTLPPERQSVPAARDLDSKIRAALARLTSIDKPLATASNQ